jgi:hypothetical protein
VREVSKPSNATKKRREKGKEKKKKKRLVNRVLAFTTHKLNARYKFEYSYYIHIKRLKVNNYSLAHFKFELVRKFQLH